MKNKKTKKRLFVALFVIFNVAAILYTALSEFTGDHASATKFSDLEINALYLIPAFLCFVAALLFETLKYHVLLKKLGGVSSFKLAFETAVFGKYYDCVTPLGSGGQPFQIYHLSKSGVNTGASAAVPVLGFLGLQFTFIVLAAVSFIFGAGFVSASVAIRVMAYVGLACYMFVPAVILLFTFFPKPAGAVLSFFIKLFSRLHIIKDGERAREKVLRRVAEYDKCLVLGLKQPTAVVLVLLYSLLYHAALYSIPFFVIYAFGGKAVWLSSFVTTVFIYSAITFIPTPGNSGAAEVSFYSVFSMLTSGYMFWATLSWRFLCYYAFILAGLGLFLYRFAKNRQKAAVPDAAEG